jgi:hypothetical protein
LLSLSGPFLPDFQPFLALLFTKSTHQPIPFYKIHALLFFFLQNPRTKTAKIFFEMITLCIIPFVYKALAYFLQNPRTEETTGKPVDIPNIFEPFTFLTHQPPYL